MNGEPPLGGLLSRPATDRRESLHLVIVSSASISFDSRTQRLAETVVARGHRVTVLTRSPVAAARALDDDPCYDVRRFEVRALDGVPLPRTTRRLLRAAADRLGPRWEPRLPPAVRTAARIVRVALEARAQARAMVRATPAADLVHAMAFLGLPTALAIGRRLDAPVVYDAGDLYVDAANLARLPGPIRLLVARVERRWARRAGVVVTVNDAYAAVLARRLGPPRPLVVMNGQAAWQAPIGHRRRFHDVLELPASTQVVLYHGGLVPDRGIEQLIDCLPLLDDSVVVVVMGYGRLEAALRVRAEDPALRGRLHIVEAVQPGELLSWVASADVAAMLIQPTSLNHRMTTPNKLFEAMAAGVPVVASDLPGMAAIVRETDCGVLCDPTDVGAIAVALRSILDAPPTTRAARGQAGQDAATGRYAWESQVGPLLAAYRRLTGRPW